MKQQHHVDRDKKRASRAVPGQPGVREIIGAYRITRDADGVGGPFFIDQGPNGGRERPRMTEPLKYRDGDDHLRMLTGNPRAKVRTGVYASSSGQSGKPKPRRRGAG